MKNRMFPHTNGKRARGKWIAFLIKVCYNTVQIYRDLPNRIRRISEEEIIVETQNTFGVGLVVGMLLGGLAGAGGVGYGVYAERHDSGKKPAVVTQEESRPAWATGLAVEMFKDKGGNVFYREVRSGCEYVQFSGTTEAQELRNAQRDHVCGGTL